jgi:phosphatidylglycerol:prolipoprotein diacylglycerol transferase
MQQILLRIPGLNLPIFGFGAMLFVAFFACTWLAGRRARKEGIAPELIQDIAIWLFVSGLLGARVLYEIMEVPWRGLGNFLWQLPRIWDGGIILYGSVIGGLAGYAVFYWFKIRKLKIPTLQLADIIAPSVALGIGIGRIGCFLNGCCYGQVACATCAAYAVSFPLSAPPRVALVQSGYQTAAGFTYGKPGEQSNRFVYVGHVEKDSPAEQAGLKEGDLIEAVDGEDLSSIKKITVGASKEELVLDTPIKLLDYHLESPEARGRNVLTLAVRDNPLAEPREVSFRPWTLGLQPTQLYETISMVLLFLLLTALSPLRYRQGLMTAVLMMGYAAHRALNELLRADPRPGGLESYFSYVLFLAGVGMAVYVLYRGKKVEIADRVNLPAAESTVKPAVASASA